MPINRSVSEKYHSAVWTAFVTSAILAVLAALVLDGGEIARLTAIALAVFWSTVVLIMVRRPQNPTQFDLVLIRSGCLPLIVGFEIAVCWVWHRRGLI
jgi:hypothetical protein